MKEKNKKVPNESINVILTDPPYGITKEGIKNSESLKIFYGILQDCYRVLKQDGFFTTSHGFILRRFFWLFFLPSSINYYSYANAYK